MDENDDRRQQGFTLIEVLVTLVLLGLLLAALAQGLRFGLTAWDLQMQTSESSASLEATDRSLRLLVESMRPGGLVTPQDAVSGHRDRLTFVGTLPAVLPMDRQAEITLTLTKDHRLVLRWRPHRHELSVAAPPPQSETLLLDGVEKLTLAYWRPSLSGRSGGWADEWSQPGLPGLVRIHLEFAPHDPRHWPDMVIATVIEPWIN